MNRREAIERAYQIPGMCWPVELGALYDLFSGSTCHIEVGSFCGRSLFTSAMALGQDAKLHVVESFTGCIGESGSMPTPCPDWIPSVFIATIHAIQVHRPDIEITIHRESSLEVAKKFTAKATSIYIDANHHFAEVCADIQAWGSHLADGGILAGHDYWPAERGVMEAVNLCLPSFRVIPNTRIWVAS
jgi:hypothetical protein